MRITLILALMLVLVGCTADKDKKVETSTAQDSSVQDLPKILHTGQVTVKVVWNNGTFQLQDTSNMVILLQFCSPVPDFDPGDQVDIEYHWGTATDKSECAIFEKAQMIFKSNYVPKKDSE